MFTFIIKNVVKSYANDLTLIAATQIALFKKNYCIHGRKISCLLPCLQISTDCDQSHEQTLRNVSHSVRYSYNAVLQTE